MMKCERLLKKGKGIKDTKVEGMNGNDLQYYET